MVMNESEAKRNYENGIESIGISAYRNASNETTISGAASTLQDAKSNNLSVSDMADKWANKY